MSVAEIGSAAAAAVSGGPGGLTAALAVMAKPTNSATLGAQLDAYGALAGRWRAAQGGERTSIAQALTESPFGRRVHATLDAYTRAAWAGPEAVPPAPEIRALKAFDDLDGADQQIVAFMQGGQAGEQPASVGAYRARLQSDVDAAKAADVPPPRRPDSVTLSDDAQARLAGQTPAAAAGPPPVQPRTREMAAALAAYAKAVG